MTAGRPIITLRIGHSKKAPTAEQCAADEHVYDVVRFEGSLGIRCLGCDKRLPHDT